MGSPGEGWPAEDRVGWTVGGMAEDWEGLQRPLQGDTPVSSRAPPGGCYQAAVGGQVCRGSVRAPDANNLGAHVDRGGSPGDARKDSLFFCPFYREGSHGSRYGGVFQSPPLPAGCLFVVFISYVGS